LSLSTIFSPNNRQIRCLNLLPVLHLSHPYKDMPIIVDKVSGERVVPNVLINTKNLTRVIGGWMREMSAYTSMFDSMQAFKSIATPIGKYAYTTDNELKTKPMIRTGLMGANSSALVFHNANVKNMVLNVQDAIGRRWVVGRDKVDEVLRDGGLLRLPEAEATDDPVSGKVLIHRDERVRHHSHAQHPGEAHMHAQVHNEYMITHLDMIDLVLPSTSLHTSGITSLTGCMFEIEFMNKAGSLYTDLPNFDTTTGLAPTKREHTRDPHRAPRLDHVERQYEVLGRLLVVEQRPAPLHHLHGQRFGWEGMIGYHSRNLPAPKTTMTPLVDAAYACAISYILVCTLKDMDLISNNAMFMSTSLDTDINARLMMSMLLGLFLLILSMGATGVTESVSKDSRTISS
ncbi:hypothetical protein F4782DRAFT_551127, partial [Xylaria castorea]